MSKEPLPQVDCDYCSDEGDSFTVIGRGTGGIVVEYRDGRVELIPVDTWQQASYQPQAAQPA